MISNYKAIIFDWDGTLVDTCGLVLDAHNHVRKTYNYPLWTMEDFLGQASQSAREYYPTVYGDKSDEAQALLYEYVTEHHLTFLKPMDNVNDLLKIINDSNIPMGVVSNKRHKTLNIEIDHMQWRSHFKSAIGAGKATKDKPATDPLLMALNEMDSNLKPADILYIGDTETDLLCAQNAKCDIALIQSDKPRPDLISKYSPDYTCNNLLELIDLIKSHKPSIIKAC